MKILHLLGFKFFCRLIKTTNDKEDPIYFKSLGKKKNSFGPPLKLQKK